MPSSHIYTNTNTSAITGSLEQAAALGNGKGREFSGSVQQTRGAATPTPQHTPSLGFSPTLDDWFLRISSELDAISERLIACAGTRDHGHA
jgi:hypothetical protein